MKLGIIGSRNLTVDNLEDYIPEDVTEIISGGAKGIDTCAQKYAEEHGIKTTVFKPNYERFGRAAPIFRNTDIVVNSDKVIAFWDGESRGTHNALQVCRKKKKPFELYIYTGDFEDIVGSQWLFMNSKAAERLFLQGESIFDDAIFDKAYKIITEDDSKK